MVDIKQMCAWSRSPLSWTVKENWGFHHHPNRKWRWHTSAVLHTFCCCFCAPVQCQGHVRLVLFCSTVEKSNPTPELWNPSRAGLTQWRLTDLHASCGGEGVTFNCWNPRTSTNTTGGRLGSQSAGLSAWNAGNVSWIFFALFHQDRHIECKLSCKRRQSVTFFYMGCMFADKKTWYCWQGYMQVGVLKGSHWSNVHEIIRMNTTDRRSGPLPLFFTVPPSSLFQIICW